MKESPTPPRTFLERIIIGGSRRSCPVPAFACAPAWRRWLSLPLRCPRGGLPSLPPAYPAFSFVFAPISPAPFPAGRGRPRFFSCKGLRPLHPRGCTHGSPRKRQEAVPYEQCRQPRRGGTGGDGTIRRKRRRRLRWSSPPGQGEPVPRGFSSPPPPAGTTAARTAIAARGGGGTPPSPL